eukprot:scaffold1508_cov178-Amphora_coffeaeformis.AAC.1
MCLRVGLLIVFALSRLVFFPVVEGQEAEVLVTHGLRRLEGMKNGNIVMMMDVMKGIKKDKKKKDAKKSKGTKCKGVKPDDPGEVEPPAPENPGSITRGSAFNGRTYDSLVLENIGGAKISWEVSPFSKVTSFFFSAPLDDLPVVRDVLENNVSISNAVFSASDSQFPSYGTALFAKNLSSVVEMLITIPINVKRLCIDGVCRPILCLLAYDVDPSDPTTGASFAPSNNEILFGESPDCKIVKPELWDEFVSQHFPDYTGPSEDLYLYDPDRDGLSNILEYYGSSLPSLFRSSTVESTGTAENTDIFLQRGRSLSTPSSLNPLDSDTDGDLLTDAFEWRYGLNPLVRDDISLDRDGDGLTELQEQIHGTDPTRIDTDSDSFNDGLEINQGSDPKNDKSRSPDEDTVLVTLTVGDPSGSHSERYTMFVGTVEHQSPDFGELGTTNYPFTKGVYRVTVKWVASNRASPDYDYFASIVPEASETLEVSVSDPEGILGTHYESTYDFAAGKSATMTIKGKCNESPATAGEPPDCNCFESCTDCNRESHCEWFQETRTCREHSFLEAFTKDGPEDCACQKCEEWAIPEIANRAWIETIPQCPCRVTFSGIYIIVAPSANVNPAVWETDQACRPNIGIGLCSYFHNGASGCIRARGRTGRAGQQCCYNAAGNLITAGSGAGTPDRVSGAVSVGDHGTADVEPFKDCCKRCEDTAEYCPYYIGGSGRTGARQELRECVA